MLFAFFKNHVETKKLIYKANQLSGFYMAYTNIGGKKL